MRPVSLIPRRLIDSKLSNKLPPSVNDLSNFPYIEALIQKALHTASLSPFALLHNALEDAEVAGYRIPKDTVVIGILYAANNDTNVWKSRKEFSPECFINEDGKFSSGDDPVIVFRTGKRSCTGGALAGNELFLFTVRMFQNFRVRAASELKDDHKYSVTVAQFMVAFERCN